MSTSNPYDYENRHGIRPISWNDFHALCKGLVRAVAGFQPEIILGVGRGGYYPATLMAHMLRAEIFPIRLSRRVNDAIVHESPIWLVRPPDLISGRRVLVVDEICSTGETLQVVRAEVEVRGASSIRTAVLYSHSQHADIPDYIGLISDSLLLNPWDREIYHEGAFVMHPEYVGALTEQGISPDPSFLVGAEAIDPAKA
jgi:uncharacterized protein